MAIRIGSSCCLSTNMMQGNVVETRRFIGSTSDWKEVCRTAIQNNQYLILTLCINRNDGSGYYPNDYEWMTFVNDSCSYLKNIGSNKWNTRLSLVNEPTKFCTKEQYAHLIDLAYPIIHGQGFLVGAGNDEFSTAGVPMYQYILENCKFDILDIHIQGICDTEEKTRYWTDIAKEWADSHGKQIDCTEAFYADIATPEGWKLLQAQLYHAERIGCPNFCNVSSSIINDSSEETKNE